MCTSRCHSDKRHDARNSVGEKRVTLKPSGIASTGTASPHSRRAENPSTHVSWAVHPRRDAGGRGRWMRGRRSSWSTGVVSAQTGVWNDYWELCPVRPAGSRSAVPDFAADIATERSEESWRWREGELAESESFAALSGSCVRRTRRWH